MIASGPVVIGKLLLMRASGLSVTASGPMVIASGPVVQHQDVW